MRGLLHQPGMKIIVMNQFIPRQFGSNMARDRVDTGQSILFCITHLPTSS